MDISFSREAGRTPVSLLWEEKEKDCYFFFLGDEVFIQRSELYESVPPVITKHSFPKVAFIYKFGKDPSGPQYIL